MWSKDHAHNAYIFTINAFIIMGNYCYFMGTPYPHFISNNAIMINSKLTH